MKIIKFNTEEEWLDARRGKITGTRLKDLVNKRSTKPKIGFYEIIAERVAVPIKVDSMLERGKRLEDEAIEQFEKTINKKVDSSLVLWVSDDDEDIAISPDGLIGKTEAIEVKCLGSARHIEAWLTQEIPSDYEYQVLQYFIVNEKLKKLYFVFYNPQVPVSLFHLEVDRKDIKDEIEEFSILQKEALDKIRGIEKQITF